MQTLQDQVEEAEKRHSAAKGQVSFFGLCVLNCFTAYACTEQSKPATSFYATVAFKLTKLPAVHVTIKHALLVPKLYDPFRSNFSWIHCVYIVYKMTIKITGNFVIISIFYLYGFLREGFARKSGT